MESCGDSASVWQETSKEGNKYNEGGDNYDVPFTQSATDIPAFINRLDPNSMTGWTIGLDGQTLELLFEFEARVIDHAQPTDAQLNFPRDLHAKRQSCLSSGAAGSHDDSCFFAREHDDLQDVGPKYYRDEDEFLL